MKTKSLLSAKETLSLLGRNDSNYFVNDVTLLEGFSVVNNDGSAR